MVCKFDYVCADQYPAPISTYTQVMELAHHSRMKLTQKKKMHARPTDSNYEDVTTCPAGNGSSL